MEDARDTRDVLEERRLPAWLGGRAAPVPVRRTRRSFLDRLIAGAAHFGASAFGADAVSSRTGVLQRLDPRVKLLTLIALGVASAVSRSFVVLGSLVALALLLALLSRVGIKRFAARAWMVAPLFTLVVALPAVTSWVSPGEPLVTVWRHADVSLGPLQLPDSLAITLPGVLTAMRLVLRVTAAVSFSVLLALTTRWDELLRSLRVLRVPRTFILVLAVAYRYVFVLVRLLTHMVIARTSRTVGRVSAGEERRFAAAAAAALFGHSQATGERVHAAMLARGYRGEPQSLNRWQAGRLDALWAACVAITVALVIVVEVRL